MAPITTKPTPTAWLIFKNSLRSGFVHRFRKFWPSLRLQISGAVLKEQGTLCKTYLRNSRGVSSTSLIIESDIAVCKEAGDEIFLYYVVRKRYLECVKRCEHERLKSASWSFAQVQRLEERSHVTTRLVPSMSFKLPLNCKLLRVACDD